MPKIITWEFFPFQNPSQLPYGKALYSYEGKEPGDLKFNKGDVIILRRRVDEHWFHGELHGVHGFLPASYVQCLRPLPQALPQGKALYDFEMKDRDQDKDCLTFTKVRLGSVQSHSLPDQIQVKIRQLATRSWLADVRSLGSC